MNSIARIYVNNIEVGTLMTSQYQDIRKQAFEDWRLYVLQSLNIIGVLLHLCIQVIRGIPMLWFLGAVLFELTAPAEAASVLKQLLQLQPTAQAHYLGQLLWETGLMSLCLVVLPSVLGALRVPGYLNVFDLAINRKIREILEVPAEGTMNVLVLSAEGTSEK